ncbi:MAG: universal stress protein [Gemmatimonadales bacterium]|jgi:nucleotide-binding universal stress UspA family protein
MYSRILVTLDHSRSDAGILTHVRGLAKNLIAMATHGHRLLHDLIRGTVANEVRHRTFVPVLLVRTPPHPAS